MRDEHLSTAHPTVTALAGSRILDRLEEHQVQQACSHKFWFISSKAPYLPMYACRAGLRGA